MGDEQEKLLDEALGIVKVKLKISRANLDAFLTRLEQSKCLCFSPPRCKPSK